MDQTPNKLKRTLYEKEKSVLNIVLVVVCILLFIALVLDLLFIDRYFAVEVSGGSMETTLFDGDILYADRYKKAKRGDIVILDVKPYSDRANFRGEFIIKRIIAIEGDCIKCEEDGVYLKKGGQEDYELLIEPYVEFLTEQFEEVRVKEGEIFFMGDHRSNSVDSRSKSVGCFKEEDIVGVVPGWALKHKEQIAAWERFRGGKTGTEE